MANIIVLVPVSKFRVHYAVARGSPYSKLDQLVLEAVNQGLSTQQSLVETFRIHPRLIVQSLITLIEAGWIALGLRADQQFVVTSAGRLSLTKGEDSLPEATVVRQRTTYLLFDCVTGSVFLESSVQYVPQWKLEKEDLWDIRAKVRPNFFDSRLDSGEIHNVLPVRKNERLHWIGPIELTSKRPDYMVVAVDLETKEVLNLPPHSGSLLRWEVVEKAKQLQKVVDNLILSPGVIDRYTRKAFSDSAFEEEDQSTACILPWTDDLLLTRSEQFEEELIEACETAHSILLLTSPHATASRLDELEPYLTNMLKRGVSVHIIPGYERSVESRDWLKRFQYERHDLPGELKFCVDVARSSASLLVWNTSENEYHAIVSAYDWLCVDGKNAMQLGVHILHPKLISDLARCVVSTWKDVASEKTASVPDRWERIARQVMESSGRVPSPPDPAVDDMIEARIVVNRSQHLELMHNWTQNTHLRLGIAAPSIDQKGIEQFLQSYDTSAFDDPFSMVLDALTIDGEANSASLDALVRAGGKTVSYDGWGGKILASDRSVCVSSFNFLSRLYPDTVRVRDIGIALTGKTFSDAIWRIVFGPDL